MSAKLLAMSAICFASLVCQGRVWSGEVLVAQTDLFGDEFGLEIDLGSDEEELTPDAEETEKVTKAVNREFDGRFTLQQEFSYDATEPTSVETNRSSLQLEWNKNLPELVYVHIDAKYNIYWKDDVRLDPGESIDDGWNIRNVYIQKTWGDLSAAIGHQIVVWGESETSVVADVFSPRNQSDFIFTSLEESRLSQLIFSVDQYSKVGRFTYIVNPFPKVDDNPYSDVLPEGILLNRDDLDVDPEFAVRWKKVIGRGDYSIFLADLTDNNVIYQFRDNIDNEIVVDAIYDRYFMLAASANYTFGNSSVQTEFAYNVDRGFQTSAPYSLDNNGVFETDQFKMSVGFNHTQGGVRNWLFGVSKPFIKGDNQYLPKKQYEETDVVFSVSQSFFHETLDLGYTLLYGFESERELHKLTAEYSFTDNLSLGLSAYYYGNIKPAQVDKETSFLTRLSYSF